MFTIGWIQDGSEFLSNSFRHKFLWSSINKEKNTRFEIGGWGRCNYRGESYFFCLNHRVIDNTISTNKLCIICTHYHYPVNVLQQKSNLFGILRSFIIIILSWTVMSTLNWLGLNHVFDSDLTLNTRIFNNLLIRDIY